MGEVVFVVALDDGELDGVGGVQIGDGLRIGGEQLGEGGLRLGQGLLGAGGGVVELAHGLVGRLALFAHAVLPAQQRHAGEGDEQAYHPQNEVDGALSLSHDVSSVAGRGPSRHGPARAGRPRGMFAAAPLPCGGGHHGSAFIRAQICA